MKKPKDYPGGHVTLIDANELEQRLARGDTTVVDCRLPRDFASGHIPGAIPLDVRGLRPGPLSQLPDADVLADVFSKLGIGTGRAIAICADRFTFSLAAYVWWLLAYLGHPEPLVLHGGTEGWQGMGKAMVTHIGDHPWAPFSPAPNSGLLVTTEELQHQLEKGGFQLIDARTESEHELGHIPYSKGETFVISHDAVFDQQTRTLKSPEALEALFLGVDREKPVIGYCRSGVRSATLIWALRTAGYEKLTNYDDSMLVWEQQRGQV